MKTANMTAATADGDITTRDCFLHSVVLTGGSDAATVVVKAGGSSGTTILTVKAAINTTVATGYLGDIFCADGIYVDVTGTALAVSVVFS